MSFKDMNETGHLSDEELRAAAWLAEGFNSKHLDQCSLCLETVHSLQMTGPVQSGCIETERLVDFAGGQQTPTASEQIHLRECLYCSFTLKKREEEFTPVKPHEMPALKSSSPAWQKKMAHRFAKESHAKGSVSARRWRFAVPALAAIALIVAVMVLRNKADETPRLIARSYEKQRLTLMRLPGARYAPLAVTRGAAGSIGSMPSEGLEAAARAKRQLEKNPTDAHWHAIQGTVYLLQGDPSSATDEYRIAAAADPSDDHYTFLLGSSLCDSAIKKDAPADFVEGIDKLRRYVGSHPSDNVALYNLGSCLYRAGILGEAQKYLQSARSLESDHGWAVEIQQMLSSIELKLRSGIAHPAADFGFDVPSNSPAELISAADSNRKGNSTGGLVYASAAESIARRRNDPSLVVWSEYQKSYALQRLSRSKECLAESRKALAVSDVSTNATLRAALFTEIGICNVILGNFQEGERAYLDARALTISGRSDSLNLRIAGMQASMLNTEGRHSEAERIDLEGLNVASEKLSAMRRYQFLSDLYLNAKAQRRFYAALEFESEAQPYARLPGNATVAAVALEDMGEACLRIRDPECSRQNFALANGRLKDFDASTREFYTVTWNLRRELIQPGAGADLQPKISLAASPITNHFVELPSLLLKSRTALATGNTKNAELAGLAAAAKAQELRKHLSTDQARFTWSLDARPIFETLVQIKLAEHDYQGALECWESFRQMLRSDDAQPCAQFEVPNRDAYILVFAKIQEAYVAWLVSPAGKVEWRRLSNPERIDDLARLLQALCSQRGSLLATNVSISRELSESLLPSAVLQDQATPIFIEPDEGLNEIPFRALTVQGQWLGISRAVSVIPGVWAIRHRPQRALTQEQLRLVGGPGIGELSFDSPKGSVRTERIASFSEISKRIDGASFVYYQGHASEADSIQAALTSPPRLRWCRLAVLAGCRTRGSDASEAGGFGVLPDKLLQAGALAVVATRWDVDSQQTEQLIAPLLNLQALADLPERLRRASLAVKESGFEHPYYWAGIEVYGASTTRKAGN